eukprot:COSAG06_NODE_1733_length_8551_cov_24.707170_3_plen_190_part_00
MLQRLGEPLAEAIASAETARAAFQAAAAAKPKKGKTETASQQAGGGGGGGGSGGGGGGGGGSNSANSAGGGSATVNNNERDEKVSRLVARGPDGTRGFHTTESGKRWTGVEAWVVRRRAMPSPHDTDTDTKFTCSCYLRFACPVSFIQPCGWRRVRCMWHAKCGIIVMTGASRGRTRSDCRRVCTRCLS